MKLAVGQWWAPRDLEDYRRHNILKLEKSVVQYVDFYASGHLAVMSSSRIQWELDVEMGVLVPSERPAWKAERSKEVEK